MMITIKSQREIERMREAGKITAAARSVGRQMLRDGVTTEEINKEIHKFILSCGATPTFLGYGGFPKSACISVNDEVIHGIPGKRIVRNGDIVSIDVGATYKGYVGDCAGTFPVGEASPEALELIRITRQSFFEGIKFARAGNRLNDISAAALCATMSATASAPKCTRIRKSRTTFPIAGSAGQIPGSCPE